jgi:hypothetical protein
VDQVAKFHVQIIFLDGSIAAGVQGDCAGVGPSDDRNAAFPERVVPMS